MSVSTVWFTYKMQNQVKDIKDIVHTVMMIINKNTGDVDKILAYGTVLEGEPTKIINSSTLATLPSIPASASPPNTVMMHILTS